jgi:hypothetical protein
MPFKLLGKSQHCKSLMKRAKFLCWMLQFNNNGLRRDPGSAQGLA